MAALDPLALDDAAPVWPSGFFSSSAVDHGERRRRKIVKRYSDQSSLLPFLRLGIVESLSRRVLRWNVELAAEQSGKESDDRGKWHDVHPPKVTGALYSYE